LWASCQTALRADATARAITEALAGLDGASVDTTVEDGAVIATITVAQAADKATVDGVLSRFALRWTVRVRS
jgi:hypothetical protein